MHEAIDRRARRHRAVVRAIGSLGFTPPLTHQQKLEVATVTELNLSMVTDVCRALEAKEAADAKA